MAGRERDSKSLTIVFPGSDRNRACELQVRPGETIRELKEKEPLLKGFSLFKSEYSLPSREDVDLFEHVEDGDIFFASSVQKVGGGPGVASGHSVPKLWVQRNWRRFEGGYSGYYRAGGFRFFGSVEEDYGLGYKVYIWDPPKCMKRHPEWKCFVHVGHDRYQIHFIDRINGVDEAILNVERLLREAYISYGDS